MKSNYKPLSVAVFLVIAGLGVGSLSVSNQQAITAVSFARPQLLIGVAEGAETANSAVLVQNPATTPSNTDNTETVSEAAVQDPGQPIGAALNPSTVIEYTVKKGDTLSGIAAQFNVSIASIVSANPNIGKKLTVGANIKVLGTVAVSATAQTVGNAPLPNFNGNFALPAQGYNEGVLQSDNSIDIENSCGTSVVASAEGIVVPDNNIVNTAGGWNDGYGTFVLIEHPFGNGVYTRYAHLQESLVSIGDYVQQGQEIGLMGQTGNADNCELSFQVQGAQNPFGK
jgi:LysM repeat protein